MEQPGFALLLSDFLFNYRWISVTPSMEKPPDFYTFLIDRIVEHIVLHWYLADFIPHRAVRPVQLMGIRKPGNPGYRILQFVQQFGGRLGRIQCQDEICLLYTSRCV